MCLNYITYLDIHIRLGFVFVSWKSTNQNIKKEREFKMRLLLLAGKKGYVNYLAWENKIPSIIFLVINGTIMPAWESPPINRWTERNWGCSTNHCIISRKISGVPTESLMISWFPKTKQQKFFYNTARECGQHSQTAQGSGHSFTVQGVVFTLTFQYSLLRDYRTWSESEQAQKLSFYSR